ncbi:nuclease-related domain-containing protein [Microbacterium sp. NPDC096154]|uniref:nuclease-related domain-containing protein n=1 Tax=Microbacterium sp. NPDC096154 TaxID=3155549 RepID=UPI003326B292
MLGRSPLTSESRPWYLGALGELYVAERLESLGPEWLVLHSVPIGTRGSDIDHVIVGPSGIFTINSKFHEGATVWVGSRRVLVNGQKTDHLRNSRYEAKRVSAILADVASAPAVPIVAIVGARQITIREQPGDVAVMRADRMVRWLSSRPATLDPATQASLVGAVADPNRWGSPTHAPADLEAFAMLRREVRAARRVRLAWVVAALPGALLLASLLPTVVSSIVHVVLH